MVIATGLIALLILIVVAAYLAASETALMRVSRIRIRYLVEKKVHKADKLENLISEPDRFLPPLLLMMLTVQLTSASLATWLATRISNNPGVGVVVGTVVIAAFMFVFGELVPKAAASHDSEKVSLLVTRPITFMSRILRPVTLVMQWIATGVLRLFHSKSTTMERIISDEGEIIAMVSAAEEHDVIEEEEKEMIHSIFEFGDTIVREVMVPRPDMLALQGDMTVKEALIPIMERGFSRIPVYGDSIDNILGVLYVKDMIKLLRQGQLETRVRDIAREAYIIPETKRLGELLREQQRSKVHMAMVVDEYGTVVGLVTIEDLLEEIVGEIFDEFDREVKLAERIGPRRYRVDARMSVDDVNEMLDIELSHEDVDTVGGLVFKMLGKVPEQGETFLYNGVRFTVEKVTENRISMAIMEKLEERAEQENSQES